MLDEVQAKVVAHHQGSLIVHAGPGSGKTKTVAERTVNLVASGVIPSDILVITFTVEAANEIKDRVEATRPGCGIWVSTIHSLGYAMLKEMLGQNIPRLIDEEEARSRFLEVCRENGFLAGEEDYLTVTNYKALLKPAVGDVPAVYKAYVKKLSKANEMDLQDLVLLPCMMLASNKYMRESWSRRWKFVTIDEAHDCTPAEATLARMITGENLCMVLDENQSIYQWREGSPAFVNTIPVTTRYQLPFTYRCPETIYRKAWNLIKGSTSQVRLSCKRPGGSFSIREGVADRVIPSLLHEKSDPMVLCRTQEEVNELTDMLKAYKIPVNRVKTMFDSYEADSIMGYAAAAMNRDFGWKKVASNPVQSITEATRKMASQVKNRAGLDKFMSAWKASHFQIDPTAEERYNEIMGNFTKGLEDFFAMLWARRMPKNNCRVMTIHASKGLEADNVIIYNVNEGRIPHRMENNVDAERRLLYVGMTRAREALTLHVGPGRTRSRFLQEIG